MQNLSDYCKRTGKEAKKISKFPWIWQWLFTYNSKGAFHEIIDKMNLIKMSKFDPTEIIASQETRKKERQKERRKLPSRDKYWKYDIRNFNPNIYIVFKLKFSKWPD